MVKLQRPDASVVAAQTAPTPELVDECPLGLLAIPSDAFRAALRTSVLAAAVPDMDRLTVRGAHPLATNQSLLGTAGESGRLEAVLFEPVSDRVVAPIEPDRDVAHTEVLADELLQPRLLKRASRRVPRRADRLKAVLPQPVRDRR